MKEEARKRGEDAPIDDMNTPLVLIEDKIEDVKNKEENKSVNKYNRRLFIYSLLFFFYYLIIKLEFVNIEATRLAYKKREKEINVDIVCYFLIYIIFIFIKYYIFIYIYLLII